MATFKVAAVTACLLLGMTALTACDLAEKRMVDGRLECISERGMQYFIAPGTILRSQMDVLGVTIKWVEFIDEAGWKRAWVPGDGTICREVAGEASPLSVK